MVVEQEEIARLLDGHRAGKFLDHLLDEANAAFRFVDSDRAKQLLFGFVAATAVADLSRVSVKDAATIGTTQLAGLRGVAIGLAQQRAGGDFTAPLSGRPAVQCQCLGFDC